MTPDQIKALAKQAGGTPYTNRYYPDMQAVAFGPAALAEFVRLVRESALDEVKDAIESANADRPIYTPDCVQIIEELK